VQSAGYALQLFLLEVATTEHGVLLRCGARRTGVYIGQSPTERDVNVARYEDEVILLDDDAVTIKTYRKPGDARRIEYGSIRNVESFEMGLWSGRYRLVGMSFGRPRNWFAWDKRRNDKRIAIGLDVGKWIRPTFVPEDPDTAEEVLREATGQ
jgi:hypothetical protein